MTFTHGRGGDTFRKADAVAGKGAGPFLWISETECVDLGTDDLFTTIPRLENTDYGRWKQMDGLCVIRKDGDGTIVLLWYEHVRGEQRLAKLSLTRDGKRISMPCTEDELRQAFGEPDKIEYDW